MQFGLTIPLQRRLCLARPPYGEVEDPFFCWELHCAPLGGADALLAVNASNRFAAIALMRPADWLAWEDVAHATIRAALFSAGFSADAVEAYLFFAGAPDVTRTHGRRPVAFLNVLVDRLLALPIDAEAVFQEDLCRFANDRLPCRAAGFEGLGLASERFAADLARMGLAG